MDVSTAATGQRTPGTLRACDAEHVEVYYDPGYYCAWPFNHGFWRFPDGELLAGFSRGRTDYAGREDVEHGVVDAERGEYVALRSTDGGRTWPVEGMQVLGTRAEIERRLLAGEGPAAPSAPFDFASPDFCLSAGFGIPPRSAPHVGYIHCSRDRGRTWEGPYSVPSLGFRWVQVKPDFLVRQDGRVLLFVTVRRSADGSVWPPTRFVAVYSTTDGGRTWHYLSSIIATSPDAGFVNRYYASPVLLLDGRILVALRCQIDARNAWPEIFQSEDGGRTWRFLSRAGDWGGPTHLTRLDDGRLVAVYGYRVYPWGIRARVSEDAGVTWGAEIVLRDDGGSSDLGYPRSVALGGDRLMTVYYFNRAGDSAGYEGGVRHIASTTWHV